MSRKQVEEQLLTDPRLVEIVNGEAKRVAIALKLDSVDAKEVYRSMIHVAIQVALEIADQHAEDAAGDSL